MTKQPTLYTFGYLAGNSARVLSELQTVQTPIVDVRFSPTSKRWQWQHEALVASLGDSYTWIKELGNELYKEAITGKFNEPHIKISSPETGLAKLNEILEIKGRAAIFCACANKTQCHRIEVARLAKEQLKVRVIHL
jgi:uncharacterized protein (DUF488 family)